MRVLLATGNEGKAKEVIPPHSHKAEGIRF